MSLSEDQVLQALATIPTPGSHGNLLESGAVRHLEVEGGDVRVLLMIAVSQPNAAAELKTAVESAVTRLPGAKAVQVQVETMLPTAQPHAQPAEPEGPAWADRIADVRHVVAVASGKGGVGKSTVAINLALALARQGLKVGLLDADIYGPSQQMMAGASGEPTGDANGKIQPVEAPGGIRVMSLGFVIDADQPVIWRGPMLMKALEQLFSDVEWGELDYLVVDLPPGTGDVSLTLCQNVPLAGTIIVTTPQDVALIDARKGLNMFNKLESPVLGIVENMAHYKCPSCGHTEHIFGSGGGQRTSEELGIPLLAAVPLDPAVVAGGDSGKAVLLEKPESAAAKAFMELADKVVLAID